MTQCVIGGMESGQPAGRRAGSPVGLLAGEPGQVGCSDKVGGLIETLGKKFGQAEYQPFRGIELSSAAYPPRGVL